jgi:hypothetical protein
VKEAVKNVVNTVTFAGGLYATYQLLTNRANNWEMAFRLSCLVSLVASRPVWHFLPKGPIFEVNPWHPRHIVSLAANEFASIALIKLIIDRKFSSKTQALVLFNFFTGRPILHLANDARRFVFR